MNHASEFAAAAADAKSTDWAVRSSAGQRLAACLDQDDARSILDDLLHDRDEGVTLATTKALLEIRTAAGVAQIASSLSRVNDDQGQSMFDALLDYLLGTARDEEFLSLCEIVASSDPPLASNVDILREWTNEVASYRHYLGRKSKE